jgi:protein involved in polysaccharide export with SLBB domain
MTKLLFSSLTLLFLLSTTAVGQETPPGGVPDYSLLPGDAVKVQIWQEPDLSGTFRVAEDTTLTLPMIGRVPTSGLSAEKLRGELVREYSAQLKNPSIQVAVVRRVSVTGRVGNPGLIDVEPTMRMGDVLAMVGGTAPDGNSKNIDVLRNDVRVADNVPLGQVVGNRVQAGDQIVVGQRSWVTSSGSRIGFVVIGTVVAVLVRDAMSN